MTTKPRFISKDIVDKAIEERRQKPYPFSDIRFLKPLAEWYDYMSESQRKELPPRVSNALDSISMIMRGRL